MTILAMLEMKTAQKIVEGTVLSMERLEAEIYTDITGMTEKTREKALDRIKTPVIQW